MTRIGTPESEERPSSASAPASSEGEPEGNIWEAKEILREKRGKVYVSWVGRDKQGRPYPSTWEPRSHCNEALLAEWDAKQARKKDLEKRRKSVGDKPGSARAADGSGGKSQKRKRESLPAATAVGPSISTDNAPKKVRRQTTTGLDRRRSLPEASGDTASTASSSSKRVLPKRKPMSNSRVVSDSDSDEDEITFLSSVPAPIIGVSTSTSRAATTATKDATVDANSGAQSKGKQREGTDAGRPPPVRSSAAVATPIVVNHGGPKLTRPDVAPPAAPRLPTAQGPGLVSSQPSQKNNPITIGPIAAVNGSGAGSARTSVAQTNAIPVVSAIAAASVPQRRPAPSAPAPLVLVSQRVQPAPSLSTQPSSSQAASLGAKREAAGQQHKSQRPVSNATASSASAPGVSRQSVHRPHNKHIDDEEAMVEDALDPIKDLTGKSASQPLHASSKPRRLSAQGLGSSWSDVVGGAVGSDAMRPRLTDHAKPVRSETDSDVEDIDDQEVIALPQPLGDRQRRSYSPANKRYLEAAAHNKALRIENAKLRDQLTQLRDTQAAEAVQQAELEAKANEVVKERTAHAATRSAARQAEQEVDSLKKEVELLRTKLRSSTSNEDFLKTQYDAASNAARDRTLQNIALEGDIQKLRKQLSLGVAQVKAFYAAQISTHDGAVDTLRTQVALLQQQHQRTGDGIRDQAGRVPGLERDIGLLRRTIAVLRDSLAEAQEDRDLAESKVEELEDQARELDGARRQAQAAYAPESDSDSSDTEYRPPGSTPAPAAPSQSVRVSADSSDEDSPLSQLVQRNVSGGVLAGLNGDTGSPPSLDEALAEPLPPFVSPSVSDSGSPASSVIEMPETQAVEITARQYQHAPSSEVLAPLADLHPSPNSVFGSQNGPFVSLGESESGGFPAGTISLQGLERGFGSQ